MVVVVVVAVVVAAAAVIHLAVVAETLEVEVLHSKFLHLFYVLGC